MQYLKKISLWVVYAGILTALASPLFVHSDFFFPYVTTKAFIFRMATQIMVLGYLFLAAYDQRYRIRFNNLNIVLTSFLAVAFASSFGGADFYRSFWGDMERSEGLLMWLHLWAFFLVLTTVVRDRENWYKLFDFSLAVAFLTALFGLAQALGLKMVLNTTGERVASTVGNAAFFAAYLLFHIFFASYLFVKRRLYWAKGYYLVLAIFFSWLILMTQTRGAAVGLVVGILLVGVLSAWHYRSNRLIRNTGVSVIAILIICVGLLYFGRNSEFVTNSRSLQRLASISTQTRTAETRLLTWDAAWKGWQQKFLLGWGMENFNAVFDSNFPPKIYEDEGSVVWFDRSHNLIFDKATTTGSVGLILFMFFLVYPIYYLWRHSGKFSPSERTGAILTIGFIVAYTVQDMFVFESVVTFVMVFFTWAFFQAVWLPRSRTIGGGWRFWTSLGVIYLVALGPVMWQTVIHPAKVNLMAARAIRESDVDENFFKKIDDYKAVLAAGTYGQEEYRLQFIEYVGVKFSNLGLLNESVRDIVYYTDEQVARQLATGSDNAKNWLLAMRNYNYTKSALPDQEESRLKKALELYPDALHRSPTRPHIIQEAGYSDLYLYKYYKKNNQSELANDAADQAEKEFNQVIDLNPQVVESYINLLMLYFNTGDGSRISSLVSLMDERKVQYARVQYLKRIQQLAISNHIWSWAGFFSLKMVDLNPNDVDSLIGAAVAYAHAGNREKAIELAEKIRSFGSDYEADVKVFIERINEGYYERAAENI